MVANLYRQDAPVLGHALELSVVHREDSAGSEGDEYDHNGFLVRPAAIGDEREKNLSTTYLGLAGDGHFDRINSTFAAYYAYGSESHNAIAERQVDVSAGMVAAELSYDIDWVRSRTSLFWASGDKDPFDGKGNGFDAIFDHPNFAGGDLSYWQGKEFLDWWRWCQSCELRQLSAGPSTWERKRTVKLRKSRTAFV